MLSNMLWFISFLISSFIFTTHSYNNKCLRHQETLLLELKHELIFNSSLSTKLGRWNKSAECCLWHGVECDSSGHVVSLQLDGEAISGGIGNSSSLFRFKYLQKLNLAYNDFTDVIPKGIGNLTYLTHLNLSNAGFVGQVPSEISSLTRLASLNISNNLLILEHPNLEMLVQKLTELRELYLDHVSITSLHERKNWGHILSSHLPNLTSLSLSYCNLFGPLPNSFWQLHSLFILRLDYNNLSEVALDDLFTNFPSLATLTLYNCSLKGSIPSILFEGVSNLIHLDLSFNSFYGNVPKSLFALPSLLELDLSYNQFNGTFQLDNFQSLPNLTLLDLSSNSLSVDVGNFNSSLKLEALYLNSCNLSTFPDFIKHLDLEELDLSNNSIAGEVPSWVWGKRLLYLNLSLNLLTKLQKPYHIPASLQYLLLASNQLKGELQMSIPFQSELLSLSLANNSFSGSIPISLCNATHLYYLDMSRNKLSGSIPPCLLENISDLDLSRNNISGSIPPCSLENISILDLSQNNISGSIPDTFPDNFPMVCGLSYLDLNNNALEGNIPKFIESCMQLEYMNVGNNMINDTFPCMLSSELVALVLHSNRFHGDLRCQGNWPNLKILDVSSNHFSGSLESINFSSLTAMVLPSGGDFEGTFGTKLDVALIMKGRMMEFHKIWSDFGTIDLSSNSFYGNIPNAIGDLNSLHQLNFSHNALNGSIPKSFGRLSNLESLDFSVNQLAGPIPEDLGGLTFLSVLNLSNNKFVGAIPKGPQMQTFSADSFQGNSGLCSFPLSINCSNTNVPPRGYDETGEEKKEIEWEYVCAAVGYVVGVGSIVWLLLFCRSFREKYFGKIEEVVEDIFIARDMRRRRARREAARNRIRRQ